MSSSLMLVLLFTFCFAISSSDESNCTYTIVTSRVINEGKPHQFSVTTLCEVQVDYTLKVWISSASSNSTRKIFKLKSGITKIYSIAIPKILGYEEHFFCAEASDGLTFYENRSVSVGRKHFSLLIQTDKAAYKPGDRVLPKFKVELFVPERFHVNANNPGNQENLSVAVSARYTFGQPLNGVALFILAHDNYFQTAGNKPSISKAIKLENGKASFEVTSSDLLGLIPCFYGEPSLEYQSFKVEVNVTEAATGIVISEKKNFISRSERLSLDTKIRGRIFKPGFPFNILFVLKKVDGESPSLSDVQFRDGSPRKIPVVVNMGFGSRGDSTLEQRFLLNITEHGTSHLTIDTNANIKSLSIGAAFHDEYSNDTIRSHAYVEAFETKTEEQLQLDLEANSTPIAFQPGKLTTFLVRSSKPITTYQYQIFAKNSLLISQRVSGDNSTMHSFSINSTLDQSASLTPEAVVIASYVTADGELIADTLVVPVTKYFFNEVQVSFSKNISHPSDEIHVIINAARSSSVALLAVDRSVKLLKTGNDITKDKVVRELSSYGKSLGGEDTKSLLRMADIIVITNNYIHDMSDDEYDVEEEESDVDTSIKKLHVSNRKYKTRSSMSVSESFDVATTNSGGGPNLQKPRTEFPETWIWTDIDDTENSTSTTLKFKVPDTITSWVLSAFAINEVEGLGVAEPTEMTVFKPLFVSLNLPYTVVRGEEFSLAVTIFNYLDTDVEVEVTLARSIRFKIRKCDSLNLQQSFETEIFKRITIHKKESENAYFWIVPTAVGLVPLEVSASSGNFVDIVKMDLLVKPEGQPQSYSWSSLLGSSVNNNSFVDFHVTLPLNDVLVTDSVIVEVSLIGNIFASTIENIRHLINLPAGCGEQNIITFAPNVYILNFLSATNELNEEKENMLTDLLLSGFGQQLTFQRRDGSYSAFGDKDAEGSVWLSAFVIKSFRHAKTYLSFEPKMVTKTLKWILAHQNSDGSFSEPEGSKILHSKMQGGSSSGVTLTAYVLIAIHENKIYKSFARTLDGSIKNATTYLEEHYTAYSNDPYILSVITYSFYLVKSLHFESAFSLLDNLATVDGDSIHWKTQATTAQESEAWKPFYEKPLTYDIEAASYALLTYTARGNANALLIAKWLIMQRNDAGGYRSTQDTVIALEALSKFARALLHFEGNDSNLQVRVKSNSDNKTHDFDRISKENSFLLQTIELPGDSSTVNVSMEGRGYAVAQLKVRYNVQVSSKHPLLELNLSSIDSRGHLFLKLSLRWLGEEASGMAIVEVETPTGWGLKDEDLLARELEGKVSKIERTGSKIVLYLDEITESYLNVDMTLENKFSTFGAKPALVKAYLYYEPDTVATAFYSASGKQTWLSACPECCS